MRLDAVAAHAVLGAYVGTAFVLAALATGPLFRAWVCLGPHPDRTFALVLLGAAAVFAAGMAITGLGFLWAEEKRSKSRP